MWKGELCACIRIPLVDAKDPHISGSTVSLTQSSLNILVGAIVVYLACVQAFCEHKGLYKIMQYLDQCHS
jgi:hypothetical protein